MHAKVKLSKVAFAQKLMKLFVKRNKLEPTVAKLRVFFILMNATTSLVLAY